jgi:hypothetical protein
MTTTISSSSFSKSFAIRKSITNSKSNQTSPLKYFDNLEIKLTLENETESMNPFEFAFDDMF